MAIHARSLADITALAASPPLQQPQRCHADQGSLILYIARVPGSRDVFLTTLKPKDQVVNAQDVQSSLYYLHVSTEKDADLLTPMPPRPLSEPELSQEHAALVPEPLKLSTLPSQTVSSSRTSRPTVIRKPLPTPPASPDLEAAYVCPLRDDTDRRSNDRGIKRKPVSSSDSSRHSLEERSAKAMTSKGGRSQLTALTLIRRDPSTGEQWNVAKIAAENFDTHEGSRTAESAFDLALTNPAYSRFECLGPIHKSHAGDATFVRRLATQLRQVVKTDMHGFTSLGAVRGYSFDSPWGSKCDFSTGSSGRALKCNLRSRNGTVDARSNVSELRFHLPTLGKRSRDDGNDENRSITGSTTPATRHQSRFETIAAIRESSHRSLPTQELDYSLGRERAGGGLIGRRAKLGKLIIDQQGQQMLDLVVAANMALWWKSYERTAPG